MNLLHTELETQKELVLETT